MPPATLAVLLLAAPAASSAAARCVALVDAPGDAGNPNDPGLDLRRVAFTPGPGTLVIRWTPEAALTFDPYSPAGRTYELVFTVEGERFTVRLDLDPDFTIRSSPNGQARVDDDGQGMTQSVSMPRLTSRSVISNPAAYASRSLGVTSRLVDQVTTAGCASR